MIDRCRCLGRSRTWRSQRGRGRCQGSPYSDLQRHSNHLLELTGFLPKLDVYWFSLYLRTSAFCRNFINAGFLGGGKHSDCRRREESFNTDTQRQTGVLLTCTDVHVKRGVLLTCTGEYRCVTHLYMQPCRSPHCCSCSYFLCSLRK